jgi:hypothetical protein
VAEEVAPPPITNGSGEPERVTYNHHVSSEASLLDTEVEFFASHLPAWLADAEGKFALVKGSQLIGFYDSELDAVRAGYQRFGNEAFLVKHIVEAEVPLSFTSFNLGI